MLSIIDRQLERNQSEIKGHSEFKDPIRTEENFGHSYNESEKGNSTFNKTIQLNLICLYNRN